MIPSHAATTVCGSGFRPWIAALRLPTARRGYRVEDVDALLHRLAYELRERVRERDEARAENRRIKDALRRWQSAEAARRWSCLP